MNSFLIDILYTITTAIVLPLITLIGVKLTKWIGQKTHHEKEAYYLTKLVNIVETAVKQVMQTYVKTLKENGNWNGKTQQEALNRCKEIIEKQLTPELKEYLSDVLKDIDTWIESQIEATIHTLGNETQRSA